MPSRILIVDDDATLLQALSDMVTMRIDQAKVDVCGSAPNALERIAEVDYDAIISDIKMPDMDGFALMERVLTLRPATPTLLVTGHGDHDLGIHALKSGAYAFIHKPIDREYFIAWLNRAIQLRQLSRTVEQQNQMLERTVQERTAELEHTNEELTAALASDRQARHHAEVTLQRLSESEERLRILIEGVRDYAIFMLDAQGRVNSWNTGAEWITGYRAEEILDKDHGCLYPEEDIRDGRPARDLQAAAAAAAAADTHYERDEWRLRKDGTRFVANVIVTVLFTEEGRLRGYALVMRDITERKRAEDAVCQRTAQFETLLNQAPLGVYLVDADFRIRHVNPTALLLFGPIPDLIGRDFDEVIHTLWSKQYADEIVQLFHHTLDTGEPFITSERIEERRDRGLTEYYDWQIHRISLPEGGYGVVCYFRDISAQVRAREAIVESGERFRALVNASAQIVWTTDAHGEVVDDSPSWRAFTGQTYEQWKGRGRFDVLHPEDRDRVAAIWQQAVTDDQSFNTTYRLRHVDGEWRWTAVRAVPLFSHDGSVRGWVGMNSDITVRKRAEEEVRQLLLDVQARERELREKQEQLVQAGKLASLGELATGVAHELNNPLNNIGLVVGNLIDQLAVHQLDPTRVRADLHTILTQVSRASKIITQVRTFGRVAAGDRQVLAIHEVMRSALDLVQEQFRLKGIEVTLNLNGSNRWSTAIAFNWSRCS